ncbi:MAG TPA: arylesterase [Myxococcales bacterium]|nr:arylesterase [Deltaproteobacteria bacterium]HAA56585.1 arylesterase [Myxococcales bacterium]|tara:strand:- start:55129 stop:55860 length:732 start_codon:yes stop_codon:yes gene_type:complete
MTLSTPTRILTLLLATSLSFGLSACKKTSSAPTNRSLKPDTKRRTTPKQVAKKPATKNVVLFVGDSLTAGFRLAKSEAFPYLIGQHWKKQGVPFRTRNAGVSGDTSAGVLRRLNWILTPDVHTVFLTIGANDGLRGFNLKHTKKNIAKIIKTIQAKGVRVLLAGMQMPPNYGATYTKQFRSMYPALAKQFTLKLMPFLLKDVAGRKELNLSDGVHPNAKGHTIVTKNVLAFFQKEQLFAKAKR